MKILPSCCQDSGIEVMMIALNVLFAHFNRISCRQYGGIFCFYFHPLGT